MAALYVLQACLAGWCNATWMRAVAGFSPRERFAADSTGRQEDCARLLGTQKTHFPGPAELTVLKALPAQESRIFFVSRHLFSSFPFAVMQVRNPLTSPWQNLSKMSWRGEPSSSRAKLKNKGQYPWSEIERRTY